MQTYEIEKMARDLKRELEAEITEGSHAIMAQLAQMSQFWDSYPALIRQTLDTGNPTPGTSPAPAAPEPTLAQRLEEMEPQAFFAAMQADPRAMLAKIAAAEKEV